MLSSAEQIVNNNIGLSLIKESFVQYNGWHLNVDNLTHIVYKRLDNDYDYFEVLVDQNKIYVSIPIKKSNFQYKTHFKSYYEANEYIETHLKNYNESVVEAFNNAENKKKNRQEEEQYEDTDEN
jgi:hypothetical protein